MKLELALIAAFIFIFAVFLIPELETAVSGVDVGEALKPIFTFMPIAFIGVVFFAIFYVGYRHE